MINNNDHETGNRTDEGPHPRGGGGEDGTLVTSSSSSSASPPTVPEQQQQQLPGVVPSRSMMLTIPIEGSEMIEDIIEVTPPPFTPYSTLMGDKKKKGAAKYDKKVSFFQLFRFADKLDIILTLIGILSGIGVGALMPIMCIVMGGMVDSFGGGYAAASSGNSTSSSSSFFNTTADTAAVPDTVVSTDALNKNVRWQLILGAISFVLRFFDTALCELAATRQGLRIRRKFFESTLCQEMGWFDIQQSGGLTTLLTDVQMIEDGIGERLSLFGQLMTTFIGGFIVGFYSGWKMAFVIISTTPLMVIVMGFIAGVIKKFVLGAQEWYTKAGTIAEETLSCIRTVTAFSSQEASLLKYRKALDLTKVLGSKKGMAMGGSFGAFFFLMFSTYALAFWYGSTLVDNGSMTAGKVLTTFMAIMQGAMSVSQLGPVGQKFGEATGAAYEVYNIIDRKSRIDPRKRGGDKTEIKGNIEFRAINFRYPTRPEQQILKNFDLTIKAGQTVALVGPSGCGKSTCVGLLMRFYDVEQGYGKVYVDGHPIEDINLDHLRQQMGIVTQEPVLFASTIGQNIAYGAHPDTRPTQEDIEKAAKEANAHDFIMKLPLGYQTLVGERGVQLSGGQKQRIAIARALIRKPKILIFDEATSALDTESEAIVQAAIDEVAHGHTCIIIAHRLSTVRNADLIATINHGKVEEQGTHDELMAKQGLYYNLVQRQQVEGGTGLKKPKPRRAKDVTSAATASSVSTSAAGVSPTPELSEKDETKKRPIMNQLKTVARAYTLLAPNAHLVTLAMIAAIIQGAIFPCFGLFFSEVISVLVYIPGSSGGSYDDHKRKVLQWSMCFVGLGILAFVVQFLQSGLIELAGQRMSYYLRLESFKAMMRQEIGWFDDRKNMTGILTTRLATDSTLIHSLTGNQIVLLVQLISSIVTGIIIGFTGSWKIALVVLACMPFVVFATYVHMRFMTKKAENNKEAFEQSGRVASEAFENARTVVSLSRVPTFVKTFQGEVSRPFRINLRSTMVHAIGNSVQSLTQFWIMALAFWYGSKLVNEDGLSFTGLMRAQMGIMFGVMMVGQLSAFFPDYGKAISAAFHIFDLLDRQPAIPFPDAMKGVGAAAAKHQEAAAKKHEQMVAKGLLETSTPTPTVELMDQKQLAAETVVGEVEFRDVFFNYPTRPDIPILQGLSFTAKPKQMIALVGASGCGKSTVVSLLERLYDPLSGTITIDGRNTKALPIEWMRSQMGLVGQEPILFADTIYNNILMGKPNATKEEVEEAARMANAHNFIIGFPKGYDTEVGEKGVTLSGGQKQRIAIARALIRNPKILLLDEATSALDSESEKIVQDALDKARVGRTTITIAHRLSTIKDADMILCFNQGRVVEQGTHTELMALGGLYATLASAQTK